MRKNSFFIFVTLFGTMIYGLLFSNGTYAKDSVSTSDAMEEIEKALIGSGQKSKFKKTTAELAVDRADVEADSDALKLEIVAVEPKTNLKNSDKSKLAYNAMIIGQYEVAIELYKKILLSEPKNGYVQFSLAFCYHKLGQYKQAKNLYYQLLKSDYEEEEGVVGNLLELIVEESPTDAVYMLAKLTSQSPNSSYILARSAMSYDKLKKPDQAILLLNRAIALDPSKIEYKFNLAVIYDKAGDYQRALQLYMDVINNYTNNGEIDGSVPIVQIRQRAEYIKGKI